MSSTFLYRLNQIGTFALLALAALVVFPAPDQPEHLLFEGAFRCIVPLKWDFLKRWANS
jgi:hypothetical protein